MFCITINHYYSGLINIRTRIIFLAYFYISSNNLKCMSDYNKLYMLRQGFIHIR